MPNPPRRIERRDYQRLELKVTAYLWRGPGEDLIRTTTLNISIGGFYCLSERSFAPGERIQCLLAITLYVAESTAFLRGDARVVRSEEQDGLFGIGCHIQSYEVINQPIL